MGGFVNSRRALHGVQCSVNVLLCMLFAHLAVFSLSEHCGTARTAMDFRTVAHSVLFEYWTCAVSIGKLVLC